MIGRLDAGWWEAGWLVNVVLPPDVLEAENRRLGARRGRGARIVPTVQELLLMRFVDLLPDFGLLESKPTERDEPGYPLPRFRRGQLYGRVLRFAFG